MNPKFNLWIEKNGQVVLSLWRVKLLEAIHQTGSISAGAEAIGVPYRIAWQKIREMEERLGEKLVETQTGGREGGGTALTARALEYIEKFNQFNWESQDYLEDLYQKTFGDFKAS
ncbi:MAG: LysR family transcriptional regulator [Anaerolineae bacterium]|nr:LysR family transcriptional regulator [Anaerolineae bacterium]